MSTAPEPESPAPRLAVAAPQAVAATATTQLLASDAEREDTVRRLHDAVGEGRLDLDEAGDRTTAAYAARHREDLTALVADLPSGTSRAPGDRAPSWASVRESLVWRAHLIVWGPGADRPTASQCRTAAVLAWVALAWFAVCALLGALVVGA
jgi:hypothetical protein